MSTWIYDEDIDPLGYYGFIYLITRKDTGRMYIGRKYITKSGGKRKERKESDWKKYWGSCKELTADIALLGVDNFERRIIKWCDTRSETNYEEVAEQIRRDVLKAKLPDGSRAYYNANIMSRWFVGPSTQRPRTDEERKAQADKIRGSVRSPETRKKIGDSKRGVSKTRVHREKLAAANLDKPTRRNKSGHVGIFQTKNGKWRATWRSKYVGQFDTIEEAVASREAKRNENEDDQ